MRKQTQYAYNIYADLTFFVCAESNIALWNVEKNIDYRSSICWFHILAVMGKKLNELFQRGRAEENQEAFFPPGSH